MSVGCRIAFPRRMSLAGYLAGALALGAVALTGTMTAEATETLTLKTVISINKITSFDISFIDPVSGNYVLSDRTNKGVDVINTATNTAVMIAGQGLFTGSTTSNSTSGPNGVMIVRSREIWAGDGDSTLKFLSLATGKLLGQVSTGGQFRADEMCYDSVHHIGFVANNADFPPFITAVSARNHKVIGKIVFDGTNGAPMATNGIEQCQWNPRDGMVYVSVPEIAGPGDNSVPGGVSRIDPLTLHVVATAPVPISSCSGPAGLAIGPVLAGNGQMLLGCSGTVLNAAANRPTAVIDDGTQGGTFGTIVYTLPFQAGSDEVWYNSGDNHYYLARSANNSSVNPNPNASVLGCPNTAGAINYGGNIYTSQNTQGASFPGTQYAGPIALGMVNALTGISNADTITGLANCTATSPGPLGVGFAGVANTHGAAHSVAADSVHNQIYVPIPSTAFAAGMTGVCSAGGGSDANGCIAVYSTVGTDP